MSDRLSDTRPAGARAEPIPATMGAHGPDRVLLGLYGLFAIAATGRSAYQLLLRPEDALLAYWLSAGAAAGYLVGFCLLLAARRRPERARTALAWCAFEFIAVLAVGSWTLLQPDRFRVPTVWSYYGAGYGFLPAVLPVAAGWWLFTRHPRPARSTWLDGPA